MDNFIREEVKGKRSQDLPTHYRLNGAIYISSNYTLIKNSSLLLNKLLFAYVMDVDVSIDIDTALDMDFCKLQVEKNR